MKKCEANGCEHMVDDKISFCSYECAGYAGYFDIKCGWIKNPNRKDGKFICPSCERELPNSSLLYEDECLWCSVKAFDEMLLLKEKYNLKDK